MNPETEKLFVASLLYVLTIERDPRVLRYTEGIPPEAITDPLFRKIYEAATKVANKENLRKTSEEILLLMGSHVNISDVLALRDSLDLPAPFMTMHHTAMELLEAWRKRRIKEYKKLIMQTDDYDQIRHITDKIYEISHYNPLFEDQRGLEEESLLSQSIDPESINQESEWLYPGFIPSGTVNFWYALPAQGKSLLALAMSIRFIKKEIVDKVLYFDADNPSVVLKQRNLPRLLTKYYGKLFYFRPGNAQEFQDMLRKTPAVKGRTFIVIDTLQRMVGSADINKTKDAIRIMDFVRSLVNKREEPGTIVILHHVNKPPVGQTAYSLIERMKGSTVFADNCDIAYFFSKKNRDMSGFYVSLINSKDRIPVRKEVNFKIDPVNWQIEETSVVFSPEELKIAKEVVECIEKFYHEEGRFPCQKEAIKLLREIGLGYHKARNILVNWDGRLWKAERINNKELVYIPTLSSSQLKEMEP